MHQRGVRIAVLAAGLSGCDYVSSVDRKASVAAMPTADQVLAAVRGAAGVDSARYVPDELTDRPVPPDSAITVVWDGAGPRTGFVEFVRHPAGARYDQHVTYMGGGPSQREVDAAYPVMLAIEARLEAVPGLSGLRRAATQTCSGDITCPSAPR